LARKGVGKQIQKNKILRGIKEMSKNQQRFTDVIKVIFSIVCIFGIAPCLYNLAPSWYFSDIPYIKEMVIGISCGTIMFRAILTLVNQESRNTINIDNAESVFKDAIFRSGKAGAILFAIANMVILLLKVFFLIQLISSTLIRYCAFLGEILIVILILFYAIVYANEKIIKGCEKKE
jgi:hypothetical protein